MTGGSDGGGRVAELEARLRELRERMEAGLPARAKELRDWASRIREPEARVAIGRLAHKVHGIAGTHGHGALGEQAARVEAMARDGEAELVPAALELARLLDAASGGSGAAPVERPVATKRLAGLRIAAVDDDDATRRLLELTLASVGGATVRVCETAPGLDAYVREIATGPGALDLVIVDAMMPDVSGLDLIESFRAAGVTSRFAVLSAATAEELGWDLPGVAWLRKPFRPSELVGTIADLLGRHA